MHLVQREKESKEKTGALYALHGVRTAPALHRYTLVQVEPKSLLIAISRQSIVKIWVATRSLQGMYMPL